MIKIVLLKKKFQNGQTLFAEGEPGHEAYLIRSGYVSIWKEDGGRRVDLANRGPGEIIGEMALIDNRPRSASVTAKGDVEVEIITQNVDDLHEQAGSSKVLHLHGELRKARSTADPDLIYTLDHWELNLGDLCEKGSQLRPHIVWFGEPVPAIRQALPLVENADIFVIIGTSLEVYPAASLVHYVKPGTPIFVVDPDSPAVHQKNVTSIREKAVKGVGLLKRELEKRYL